MSTLARVEDGDNIVFICVKCRILYADQLLTNSCQDNQPHEFIGQSMVQAGPQHQVILPPSTPFSASPQQRIFGSTKLPPSFVPYHLMNEGQLFQISQNGHIPPRSAQVNSQQQSLSQRAAPIGFQESQRHSNHSDDLPSYIEWTRKHVLFNAMHEVLRLCLELKAFEDAKNKIFSPNAKHKIPMWLILPELGLMSPTISQDRYGYLDVDVLLLMHHKEAVRHEIKASKRLKERLDPLLQKMEACIQQMSLYRPLLNNEHFSRLFLMTTGYKLMQVELHMSSSRVLNSETRKKNLPDEALKLMQDWFGKHQENPYPSTTQKKEFAEQGGLTLSQVEYWFVNARSRQAGIRSETQPVKPSVGNIPTKKRPQNVGATV